MNSDMNILLVLPLLIPLSTAVLMLLVWQRIIVRDIAIPSMPGLPTSGTQGTRKS